MARLCGNIVFTAFVGLSPAAATLLDWNTVTWTPGSLTNSYDVDPGSPGNGATTNLNEYYWSHSLSNHLDSSSV